MTKQEAIDVLKSECYVFNPLNFDRTTLINTALDVAIESLQLDDFMDTVSKNSYDREFNARKEAEMEAYKLKRRAKKLEKKLMTLEQAVIEIPEGATNGEMIKAMFNISDSEIDEGLSTTYIYTKTRVLKGGSQDRLREQITFDREWWNAPYKGSEG